MGVRSLSLVWAVGLSVVGALGVATETLAQIVPDDTLGPEESVVIPDGIDPVDVIFGGATRDQNLVHSFTEFNVDVGRGAYFFSPSPEIQSIFSRVTGTNRSNILGTLGTFGNSVPNLWLINPNGILFGPDASLDLGGSFFATTADAVQIDEFFVAATSEPPTNQEILTIGSGVFFFDAFSEAEIVNQSRSTRYAIEMPINGSENFLGLQVLEGNAIGFIGQDINFDGQNIDDGGVVNAPNGDVLLLSTNTVDLKDSANIIGGNISVETRELSLQDGSQLLVQFDDTARLGNFFQVQRDENGNIQQTIFIPDDALQELPTFQAGSLSVIAQESVTVSGTTSDTNEQSPSLIGTDALGLLESGGDIFIQTPSLIIENGGQISSQYVSLSEQNEGGGNVFIVAGSVNVVGEADTFGDAENEILPSRLYIGNANSTLSSFEATDGSINVSANEFSVLNGAEVGSVGVNLVVEPKISQTTLDVIEILAPNVLISGVSETANSSAVSVDTSLFSGQIISVVFGTEIITIQDGGQVNGSQIVIAGNKLTVQNDSQISGNTSLSISDMISIENTSQVGSLRDLIEDGVSFPVVVVRDNAQVGPINLRTSELTVQDNAQVSSLSNSNQDDSILPVVVVRDNAQVGSINLRTSELTVQDNAQVSSLSNSNQDGGILPVVVVRDNAQVGPINLRASELIIQDDAQVTGNTILESINITIRDTASVNGSTIDWFGENIVLRDQAEVRADELDFGSGGTVDITTVFLSLLDSAQLSANVANTGNGGTINIVAYDSGEEIGSIDLIGDPTSGNPSSISATVGGPGSGGGISIDTGSLRVQNGSQITTQINGGGTGGSIDISATDALVIEGMSESGTPSLISAEMDLRGGEFGILRHIELDPESKDNVFLLLESIAPNFFIGEGVIDAIPGRADELLGQDNLQPFEGIDEESLSASNSVIVRLRSLELDLPAFGTNSIISNSSEENPFFPDGLFMFGQSFGLDFDESIDGGKLLALEQNLSNQQEVYQQIFLSSFEEADQKIVNEFSEPPFDIAENQILRDEISNLKESFLNGAGEFYVVESTSDEFRIQDSTFIDTRFLNIQPGDLFLIFAVRDGGDININTGNLTVRNGAQISTNSLGAAQGGAAASNLSIEADSVLVENNSSISAAASTGSGGNILVQSSDLQLNDNATLTAEARDNAGGGNVTLDISGDVRAVNSNILANSAQTTGGTITIDARDVRLEGDSDIRTNVAAGDGDGGDIDLTGRYIFAFDDSDILANAEDGRGGDINLNVRGFFGENFTPDSLNADPDTLDGNDRVDVNATGAVNGVVSIPDISFIENSLSDLSDTIVSPDQILIASCISRTNQDQGTFNVTGSGGLPTSPNSDILSTYPTTQIQSPTETTTQWQLGDPINEATGIYQLADGRLALSQDCGQR
ncbi:MAG: filamentous hemagglutinin N-terminal domain-containing protein [Leptolyngbya sp. SIO3F4]|nr:filamentous hemagglutinin N-terminal domain-containing protein [Leptolyngbya sp. SIO3F4]